MKDGEFRRVRCQAGWPLAVALGLVLPTPTAAAQDTTTVMRVPGLRVEVPRPTTTTGGTSAVEFSLDSAVAVAAPTMEEFLRRMPLIQIRANSRGEAQPSLRGAEDRQIAILLDGVPLTVGWDHRTDMSVIPLTAVRKVTLLRGLSSMLHGPNVLGGALEFDVVRASREQSLAPEMAAALSVDQEGGTGASATGSSSFETASADWLLRAGAGYRRRPGITVPGHALHDPDLRQGYLVGEDGLRLNSDRRQVDGFLAARYLGSGGSWASGLVSAFDVDRGVPPEVHVDDPRFWRYPDQARVFAVLSGGTGERTTRLGHGDLEASLGWDRSATAIADYGTPDYTTMVDREDSETTTVTGRLLADHVFESFGELRGALTFSDVSHRETFLSGPSFDYEQRLWSLGAEIEAGSGALLGGSDNGQHTLWTLGASIDGADTPLAGDKEPLGTMWDWGARAGATRSGWGGRAQYHVGVSRRTRFPSLRELYSGALGRFEPNPVLMPENLIAAEAGVTLDAGGTRLQMVAFHHHLRDGIVRTRTVTPEGNRFKRVNRDEVRSTGIEVLVAGTTGRLTFGGDLTLQRVSVTDPAAAGQELQAEYEPAVAGTLNLGARAPWGVGVHGFMRFRGTQFCENVEVTGSQELHASVTADLEARRTFFMRQQGILRQIDGTVAVANATDTMVMDQCGLPQSGRTFRVQVNVR